MYQGQQQFDLVIKASNKLCRDDVSWSAYLPEKQGVPVRFWVTAPCMGDGAANVSVCKTGPSRVNTTGASPVPYTILKTNKVCDRISSYPGGLLRTSCSSKVEQAADNGKMSEHYRTGGPF